MWAHVEADFRRDYGIILSKELPKMSWREFQVLLKGLSPWGSVATNYKDEMKRVRVEQESGRGELTFWQRIASIGKPGEG